MLHSDPVPVREVLEKELELLLRQRAILEERRRALADELQQVIQQRARLKALAGDSVGTGVLISEQS